MERIVVGVDGSAGARRALEWARDEAKLRSGVLVAVHAWQPPVPVVGAGMVAVPPVADDASYEAAARRLLEEEMEAVGVGASSGVAAQPVVAEGPPGEVLVRAAHGASLLVVGSRGRSALMGMLLGSVSSYCSHHSPCPVVIVHG